MLLSYSQIPAFRKMMFCKNELYNNGEYEVKYEIWSRLRD